MTALLVKIWRLMKNAGTLQWYTLWLFHAKFIIGVSGVILNSRGEVLLLRHRYWPVGSWGLPSGYAIRNETLEQTLQREMFEECGCAITVDKLLRVRSGFRLRLEASFLGTLAANQELRLDAKEVIEAGFFALDSLPEGLLPSHREIISLVTPQSALEA